MLVVLLSPSRGAELEVRLAYFRKGQADTYLMHPDRLAPGVSLRQATTRRAVAAEGFIRHRYYAQNETGLHLVGTEVGVTMTLMCDLRRHFATANPYVHPLRDLPTVPQNRPYRPISEEDPIAPSGILDRDFLFSVKYRCVIATASRWDGRSTIRKNP